MTLADQLAGYTADVSYSDLDNKTVEEAKRRVLDSLACSYAALGEKPVENLIRYVSNKPGEEASLLCVQGSSELSLSALVAGGLVRYLDWNDTYLSKEPGHPSDNLGALLTVADAYNCTGKTLILATVLAYEIQCRLCDVASLRKNGFDHVNYGLVSATLGSAKLMGLDREKMVEALNIALNSHVALRQARAGELSEWKGFAFANVSRNAVLSCQLADEGIQGPKPIFEGKFGVFNQLTGSFSLDVDSFGGKTGDFKLKESYIKFYPVEYHAQAGVHLALKLAEEGLDWRKIDRIENETYEAAVSIIGEEEEKWDPKTRETADHSMPYCIARSIIDGEMTLEQFSDSKIKGKDVRQLMDKMSIEENPKFTEEYGEKFPHTIRIHMKDGKTYERTMEYPKGHPGNRLSDRKLEKKFRQNAVEHLKENTVSEIIKRVKDLENEDVGEIIELTEVVK